MKNQPGSISILFLIRFSLFFFCCISGVVQKSFAQPQVIFSKIADNLNLPDCITNAGDGSGRLFITEQAGVIKIFKNGVILSKPFLDISNLVSIVGNDQGLFSIAFSPKYNKNRTFFVLYTALNNNITLASYKVSKTNPDSATKSGSKTLLSIPKEGGSLGRNGGDLHFGTDKYLYVSIGDGGTGSNTFDNPQDGLVLNGKLLRIKTNSSIAPYYTIPPDNPYVNDPNVLDEIWALGLRQPWRFTFDRTTNDIWMTDVGQSTREEVTVRTSAQSAKTNYGWPCYEGDSVYKLKNCGNISNYTFPVLAFSNNLTDGGHGVMGGYVYRGAAYPALQGYYICGDLDSRNLWKIKSNGTGGWNVYPQPGGAPKGLVSFGEGEDAEMYALSIDSGTLYKVQATGAIASATPTAETEPVITENNNLKSSIYPTNVTNNLVTLDLKESFSFVRLVDMQGQEFLRKTLEGESGRVKVNLPPLSDGMYIVQLVGKQSMQQKIYITR